VRAKLYRQFINKTPRVRRIEAGVVAFKSGETAGFERIALACNSTMKISTPLSSPAR
jgi:hypothetical protein